MTVQSIRYAVGQIAFLTKGPQGETLGIPEPYFGKPCVIEKYGVIRMLSDDSGWAVSSQKHLMLAFPNVGDTVRHGGEVRTVDQIDHENMTPGSQPLHLRDAQGIGDWPEFQDLSVVFWAYDPDMALLPEEDAKSPAPLAFKVGDKVQTSDGPGVVEDVDAEDALFPYLVRLASGELQWLAPRDVTPALEKHTLTLEFDSADDLAIAKGILGNLTYHPSADRNAVPALARVLRTLQDVGSVRSNAWCAVGDLAVYLRAGWHEKDGKLCEKD